MKTPLEDTGRTGGAAAAEARRRSMRAVKWSALGEVTARSIQPLMLLVLVKLLSPEDFGVVGVATIAIGLAQILQEFGFGKALVQTPDAVEEHADNAFWMGLGLAVALYAAILAFADPIAAFFQSPRSAPVLRVLGLQIVLASLVSVHLARLQREIRFKSLFVLRFVPTLATGLLSVALAFAGHGVWSIVWGSLAGAAAQVALCWIALPWRPRLQVSWERFRRMFAFSRWVLLESALAWTVSWADSIALGHFLGPEILGYYRVGSVVVAYVSNVVFTSIVPVAFALLARLQHDRPAFLSNLGQMTRMVVLLSLPIGAGCALLGAPAAQLVLGEKWAPAGVVIQLMGLRMGLEWLVGLNSTAFAAMGRPEVNVKTLVAAVLISVPAYLWAAPLGLVVFCWARLLTAQAGNGVAYLVARRVLSLPPRFLWDRTWRPALAALAMGLAIAGLRWALPPVNLPLLLAAVAAGAVTYAGVLWCLDRPGFSWAWGMLTQMLARNPAAAPAA